MEVPLARRVSPWSHRTHRAERLGVAFEDADAAEVGCSGGIACGDWGSPGLRHPRCGLDPVRRGVGERFTTAAVGAGDGTFSAPSRAATDSSNNVYVTDSGNSRVQKFNSTGTFLSKFGSLGIGNGQFLAGSALGVADRLRGERLRRRQALQPGREVQLGRDLRDRVGHPRHRQRAVHRPTGIAIDPSSGNVYVADTGNNRIQKFTSTGTLRHPVGKRGHRRRPLHLSLAASPSTPPATCTSPTPATAGSRSSRRRAASSPSGEALGRATGSSGPPPRRRSISRSAPRTT